MFTIPQLISIMKCGHPQDINGFDREFQDEIASFAAHLQRCYVHLHHALTIPEGKKPAHVTPITSYLLDGANSLMAAFSVLRQGYPIQALDLGRRVVESTSVAVYISDHPSITRSPEMYRLSPSKCVAYAKRHMQNVGRAYGFFSEFDHAHSAVFAVHPVFSGTKNQQQAAFPLGPCSVGEKRPLFTLACLRLLATAHNLEGVVEMLLFSTLKEPKRYWVTGTNGIEYQPIDEELQCERVTASRLAAVGNEVERQLARFQKLYKGRHHGKD